MLLFLYLIPATVFWVLTSLYLLVNCRKVKFLKDHPTLPAAETEPRVAVIIAVRNEERKLRSALESVCSMQYANYRIIVVNDRSTDGTANILQSIKIKYPRITIIEIQELPAGWLGKNHALYQGYLNSLEEWMLFTDADVMFEQRALSKAIQYAKSNHLDHLAILPEINSPSEMLSSVLETFKIMLELRQRPWNAANQKSSASIGIGAFNLVRRAAYERAGTHSAISLRPDDDLKLGERIKAAGLRQGVLYGDGEIWLEWYSSLKEFIGGLMKNTFSVSDYNLVKALTTALATLFFFALPLPVLLLTASQLSLILAAILILVQVPIFAVKRGMKGHWWYTFMMPVAGGIMAYILVKSALLTLRQGGIYWRDSFYSLKELKANK